VDAADRKTQSLTERERRGGREVPTGMQQQQQQGDAHCRCLGWRHQSLSPLMTARTPPRQWPPLFSNYSRDESNEYERVECMLVELEVCYRQSS